MIGFTLLGCGSALLVYYIIVKLIDHYNKLYPYISKYRFDWYDYYTIEQALEYISDSMNISLKQFYKTYNYTITATDEYYTIKIVRRDFT